MVLQSPGTLRDEPIQLAVSRSGLCYGLGFPEERGFGVWGRTLYDLPENWGPRSGVVRNSGKQT